MSEVLYKVWLQDDRGEFGDLRRMDNGTWSVRPAWLTGWLPNYNLHLLRQEARVHQWYAAGYWKDKANRREVANDYYIARWWYDAYSHALRWERQYGEPTGRKVL